METLTCSEHSGWPPGHPGPPSSRLRDRQTYGNGPFTVSMRPLPEPPSQVPTQRTQHETRQAPRKAPPETRLSSVSYALVPALTLSMNTLREM